jgi:acetyl esterase/lipase
MKVFNVDLYEYFSIEKPSGAQGVLTCYLQNLITETYKDRSFPAILVIPGGAYAMTSQREKDPIALKYLSNGYNAFILNYSVSPLNFPTQFIEASMAMAYIRDNAKNLNVRKDRVCALGCSAGGHLLGTISTMFERSEIDFLGDKKAYVRPDASIFMYPVISGVDKPHIGSFINLLGDGYEDKLEEFSIDKNVSKNCPPAFIVSTVGDLGVPCRNSLLLARAYEEYGVPFELHIFERGRHGLSTGERVTFNKDDWQEIESTTSKNYYKWVELSLNWLKERDFEVI